METLGSLSQKTDEELMDMFRQGEPIAFEILYSRYAPRVLGYLKKQLGNEQLALDLFQETFLKLHRSRMIYDSSKAFSAWLFTLCRNVMIDSFRVQNKFANKMVEFEEMRHTPISSEVAYTNAEEKCSELLATLNSREQEILRLRYNSYLSFDSISERLGLSLANVRKISSRALKRIRGAA